MTTRMVDATVVTDALLKSGARAVRARAALDAADVLDYALKEVRHGPFGNFVYTHNLLATTRSMQETRARVAALTMQRYKQRTAQEALDEAAKELEVQPTAAYVAALSAASTVLGESASADRVIANLQRLVLERVVRRAERELNTLRARALHRLSCFQPPAVTQGADGHFVDGVRRCSAACALGALLATRSQDVSTLADVVAGQPSKPENVKREAALRFVATHPGTAPTEQCRALGDAVYALLCPTGGVIVTTNVADHAPLAAALGSAAQVP